MFFFLNNKTEDFDPSFHFNVAKRFPWHFVAVYIPICSVFSIYNKTDVLLFEIVADVPNMGSTTSSLLFHVQSTSKAQFSE